MALSSTFIQQMYVAYFGRPADPGGLVFYAGFSEASLIQGFANSPESKALYGASTPQAAIDAVYQNLFNRPAEPAGLQAWYTLLVAGRITLANMALSILRGAANDDLVAINNKVAVANLFTSHVDTAAEIAGYSGNAAAAAARSFLKAVGSSQDSVTAAQTGVDKAVNTVATAVVPPVPKDGAVSLTANADTLVGGSGDDAFTGSGPGAFGFGDSIDGGGGNNTLTVTGETGTLLGNGITVANVQSASLASTGGVNLDTTGWSGLANLTVVGSGSYVLMAGSGTRVTATVSGVPNAVVDGGSDVVVNATSLASGSITVGSNLSPTGTVTVNASSAYGYNVFVKGGSSVTVNASGTVTVVGTSATTAVAVNAAQGTTANVLDVNANTGTAGTISSVTTSGGGNLNINDNALTSLTLGRGVGNVNINNGGAGTAASRTLNLALDLGRNLGAFPSISDANVYDTINLSGLNTDFTYVSRIFGGAVKNLNLLGSATLDFTLDATSVLTGLQTVTMSGSGTVYINFGTANPLLSLIDASRATGVQSADFDPSHTRYAGGAGRDVVSFVSTTISQAVDLGDGDDTLTLGPGTTVLGADVKGGNGNDTLTMQATDAASITAAGGSGFASHVSGFENLQLYSPGTQVVDLALFGGSINNVFFANAGPSTNLTLNHFVSGGTLNLVDSVGSVTVNGDFSGGGDVLNIKATTQAIVNGIASMGVKAAGVENVFVQVQGGFASNYHNTIALNLQDTAAAAIIVTNLPGISPGALTLALSTDSTAITSVDASGMPSGSLAWTSGALANAVVVVGSAQGNDALNLSGANHGVTFTGGSGSVSIYTGDGNDVITVGSGANTIIVGNGADRVNITGVNSASATVFTSITAMTTGGGDSVSVGGNVNTMGSRTTDLGTTLLADLNAAAADSASTSAPVLHWFTFGGDTYIVKDVSAGSSFVAGADMVVKLVGTLDLGGVGVAGGVITL